jgi:hypothetical protein
MFFAWSVCGTSATKSAKLYAIWRKTVTGIIFFLRERDAFARFRESLPKFWTLDLFRYRNVRFQYVYFNIHENKVFFLIFSFYNNIRYYDDGW